jgi:outer membrane putative beta-barrel porin/alpha-amylase
MERTRAFGAGFSAAVVCALLSAAAASAQDLEPRAYSNVPVGVDFLVVGFGYTEGSVETDPALPIEDAKLDVSTSLLAWSRSFGLLGRLAKVDVIAPYSKLSGSARVAGEEIERHVTGLGDPRLRLTWIFYGAPALSSQEWRPRPDDLVVGASVQVIAPAGQYDDSRVVNLGTNRWAVKSELGISKARGPVSLELASAVTFFQDNDDFLGQTREQDPLYALQAHLVYSFRRGLWLALDGTYYLGGRTRVGGILNDDLQRSTRTGATFAMPLSARQSLKLYASTGVSTRIGGDWDAIGLTWQIRWAGP